MEEKSRLSFSGVVEKLLVAGVIFGITINAFVVVLFIILMTK